LRSKLRRGQRPHRSEGQSPNLVVTLHLIGKAFAKCIIGRTGDNEPRFLRDLGRSSRCADPSAAAPIPKWQALLRPRHVPEGRRDGVSHRKSNWNPTAPSARGPRVTVSMSIIDLSQFLFGSGIRNRGARQIYSTASRDVGDHVINVLRTLEARKCHRGLGIVPFLRKPARLASPTLPA
jgi:hypothetical protein